MFDEPAEQPDEIGETVKVSENFRLYNTSVLDEADDMAFGTTADRAGNLKRGRFGVRAGQ